MKHSERLLLIFLAICSFSPDTLAAGYYYAAPVAYAPAYYPYAVSYPYYYPHYYQPAVYSYPPVVYERPVVIQTEYSAPYTPAPVHKASLHKKVVHKTATEANCAPVASKPATRVE